jgi:hypothetical protein
VSYLSWLNESYVPSRSSESGPEVFSPESELHKAAKEVFAKYDELLDPVFSKPEIQAELFKTLVAGSVSDALSMLLGEVSKIPMEQGERATVENFCNTARNAKYDAARSSYIGQIFAKARNPRLFAGNSVLFTLVNRAKS